MRLCNALHTFIIWFENEWAIPGAKQVILREHETDQDLRGQLVWSNKNLPVSMRKWYKHNEEQWGVVRQLALTISAIYELLGKGGKRVSSQPWRSIELIIEAISKHDTLLDYFIEIVFQQWALLFDHILLKSDSKNAQNRSKHWFSSFLPKICF